MSSVQGDTSLNILNSFKIREINETTRFWMIRTKKGFFFDEFINEKFIALGWNIITFDTDMGNQSIDALKQRIRKEYGDSRPMGSINKCKSFIYDIKEGDYIVIPNNGSTKIAFARAGQYFEDVSCDIDKEKRIIKKIENNEYEISEVKCPYKKRRHIEVINIVSVDTLGYGLRRALSSYHGISNFDEYAIDILNGIYDCYTYCGDMHLSVNITKQGELKPREISQLLYALTEIFCGLVDEDSISTTINLNSPGSIRIKLKEGFNKITKAKIPLICMFLAITGGSGFGFELPGLAGAIKEYRTMEMDIEKTKIDLELKEVELETKKIENAKMLLEVLKEAETQDVKIEDLLKQFGVLQELDNSLRFETKENKDACIEVENVNGVEQKVE